MVAYSLVNMVGRASAANILGITVRELDKLVEIYDLSEKLTNLAEPGASITWAREIKNLNRKILTPTVVNTIIRRISRTRHHRSPFAKDSTKNVPVVPNLEQEGFKALNITGG